MGLINLYHWARSDKGKACFEVADTKGTDYFFASCSIYLTMLTFEIVKEGLVEPKYWYEKTDDTYLQAFQKIYDIVFEQFSSYWLQVADKSFMQFNLNLIAFSKLVKKQEYHKINQRLAIIK